jgi:molecular chaperone DnaJ
LAKRDYYEILGVSRDTDAEGLKSAYRKLALQYHPDRNPDDAVAEEKFKEASEAYAILSDEQKRAAYDRFGHDGVAGAGGAGGFPGGDFAGFGDIFNDLFGDIFGGGGGARAGRRGPGRGQRGADLRYNLEIKLSEAAEGLEASIQIPKTVVCETCDGQGTAEGTEPERCASCGGSGQAIFQQGLFRISRPCDMCGGAGSIVRNPCGTCRGSGRVEGERTLSVQVPAGVDDGMRLRVAGEGEAGVSGGPPGDLYVVLSVTPHPLFERDGADLHCERPIPFTQAVLGGEIDVPTLEGRVNLRIPEGTQSGKIFRLRGKGMPDLRDGRRGDQYVRIFVEVPTKLTRRQRELLEEFADETGSEISPVTKGFLEKLKDLFD